MRSLILASLFASAIISFSTFDFSVGSNVDCSSCSLKGKKLFGKFKVVESFPDLKVKVVTSFPDLKVKLVSSFPDDCGEWQMVESFPDVKIQFVESFPDLTIQYVDAFPGCK